MAIQGTQVPKYTKRTLFLYFSDFSKFFFKFYENHNKAKLKTNRQNMLNKAQYKNQTDSKTRKLNTQVMHTQKEREREKVTKSLRAFFLPHLERTFPFGEPLIGGEGEELKSFKFKRNIRALRRSPRGAKKDGN